ncbi:MAG TPA: hypothetical protein VEB19_04265, partial [Gemmatimonadaceae bacterium]|nr:hypothetical protein [Gemmatimonadaceae bacterium]
VQSSRVKYRDNGAKPTVVQGGMSSMQVRALLAKSGATQVELTTGSFDRMPGRAILEKVQLRVLTASNVANIRPERPEWTHTMAGLVPGDRIRAQANVRGEGFSRMEVLDTVTTVVRRPDIAVRTVGGATQAQPGVPVTFFADLAELNGDVGGRANCRLLVDNVPRDEATAIWVDAGDIVSCQFSFMFENPGTYEVQISALDVQPADWDTDNNSNSLTITVLDPGAPMRKGEITFTDANYEYGSASTRTGDYPLTSFVQGTERWSRVDFSAQLEEVVPAPLQRIEAKVTANGATVYESVLTEFASYSVIQNGARVTCVQYWAPAQTASSCTKDYFNVPDSTSINYSHQSGRVTYYGQTLYCHLMGCDPLRVRDEVSVYSWGEAYGLAVGSNVQLQVKFVDAVGETRQINQGVLMTDASENFDRTACGPYWDGLGDVCKREYQTGLKLVGRKTW